MKGRVRPGVVLDGTYHIVRLVGEGGMGEVYEARHARLAGRYAVKVMHPEIRKHPEVLLRFQREAQITSALRHPGIVQVIDFNTAPNGAPYLVMEYLEGEDLGHVITREGALALERVVSLTRQIASALGAAHRRGVVHRDLKPQNIFLLPSEPEEAERAKVLDFGISKIRSVSRKLTATSVVLGTPQFMAPEQAEGREEVDAAADQFSFAAIVYEMLTGRPAFTGETLASVVYQIVHAHPVAVTRLRPDVPGAVHDVLARALAKDRTLRFPSTVEFARALRAAAGGRAPDPLVSVVGGALTPAVVVPPGSASVMDAAVPAGPTSGAGLPTLAFGAFAPPRGAARVAIDPLGGADTGREAGSEGPPGPGSGDASPEAAGGSGRNAFSTTTFRRMTGELARLREMLGTRRARMSVGAAAAAILVLTVVIASTGRSRAVPSQKAPPVAVAPAIALQPLPAPPPVQLAPPRVSAAPPAAPVAELAELELASEPAGVPVRIDGKPFPGADNQAVTRMRASLPPGPHVLELAAAGYQPWRRSVELKTSGPNRFVARLKKDADPAAVTVPTRKASPIRSPLAPEEQPVAGEPPPRCSLTVGATPWAELWVDGRDTHRHTPVLDLSVPCGARQVSLRRPDLGIDHRVEVTLVPGQPLKRIYKIAPAP